MTEDIKQLIKESIDVKTKILATAELLETISEAKEAIVTAFENHKKVLFCGNGGSAADAQHLSAELSGRFRKDRPALYADALHCNSSYLTAVANDYSFADVYDRLIRGIAVPGDILVAISTSGNSDNIINATKAAQEKEMIVIGLTGGTGGQLVNYCHYSIIVPSSDTARIQEAHILIGHIICELVETRLFPDKEPLYRNRPFIREKVHSKEIENQEMEFTLQQKLKER